MIRRLEFDRHFSELEGDLAGCLRIFVPANETPNGSPRTAILSASYSEMIREFLSDYRPALDISGTSLFVFPGIGASPLRIETISKQQSDFLRNHFDAHFTPELIRLIIKHLILSVNPDATSILSDVLGLRDPDHLKRLAAPYQQQQDLREKNDLIVSGQLA